MKINDIVRYKKFPFEKELFIIVGDKKNPWLKPSPYHPGGKKIFVEDNKDFILLIKDGQHFGTTKIDDNGLHVNNGDLELIKSP
ncbi:hypothetical protein ACWBC2_16085 [Salegentibacter agarivorans]